MTYEIGLRVFFASTDSNVACTIGSHGRSATIIVINSTDSWVAWTGGTNYDINAGDAAHGFSFQGPDPDIYVQRIIRSVTPSGNLTAGDSKYSALYEEHLLDFKDVMAIGSFSLNLGQKPDLTKTTASLMTKYRSTSSNAGSPYIEWLAFNLGRYLLAASARGRLPANLQGIWAKDTLNPWSAGEFFLDGGYTILDHCLLDRAVSSVSDYHGELYARALRKQQHRLCFQLTSTFNRPTGQPNPPIST